MKVFVVGPAVYYAKFLKNVELVEKQEDADVVLFTGGEDVDPSTYGHRRHPRTYSNILRDEEEIEVFKKIRNDQLAFGICRGSQFLCAVNGGNWCKTVTIMQ